MKLSPQTSGSTAPRHVDLELVKAITDGSVPLHEVRVAWALSQNPDVKGLRAIERASGLSRESVLKILPQAGAGTDLLSCSNRGQFAWDPEDRKVMRVTRRWPSTDHNSSSTDPEDNYVWEIPGTSTWSVLLDEEDEKTVSGRRMDILDPSLDIWSNSPDQLGDHGWTLAFATGCGRARLTLAELAVVCRVSVRQARRVMDRLAESPWGTKVRTGRRVVLDLDFEYLLTEEGFLSYAKTGRLAHKAQQHSWEASAVRTMGTERGRTVREMWKNRRTEVAMLREWASETGSRAWDNLIWVLENARGRWSGERLIFKDLGPVRA